MPVQKSDQMKFWVRAEWKPNEQRTPLTPRACRELLDAGHEVMVERSPDRCYPIEDYNSVGCDIVEEGSWPNAPTEAFIVGIKELPLDCRPLVHKHIYFGHAYKGQDGWQELLSRFYSGGGELLDVEYIVDDKGVREVAEFGPMAGLCGCALGVAAWCHQQLKPEEQLPAVKPFLSETLLVSYLRSQLKAVAVKKGVEMFYPKILIIGSSGRCGRGAVDILEKIGFPS